MDAFKSIGNFFASSFEPLKEGFSDGIGWTEQARREEERKKSQVRDLEGEELQQALRDDWERNYMKSFVPSQPSKLTSTMLLSGAYRR
ncbi:hypothetical protein [Candidatus Liberibacter brunswickensis]|uniref:hypothetical protein n=1 Tax=Candidatus Liberibacter brunswickensis TaxID=1968796 RepID=UPI002FE3670C